MWTGPEVDRIFRSFYSDDFCGPWESAESAIKTIDQVTTVLEGGGFHLRGFVTNESKVLHHLKMMHKAKIDTTISINGLDFRVIGRSS